MALLDFDRDGDTDLYVTNGPGTPNSLFANQLRETGVLAFVDTGLASGAAAVDQWRSRTPTSTWRPAVRPRGLAAELC